MSLIKPKFDPPIFDLADDIIKFNEEHPEEDNYIEKNASVINNYFRSIDKPKLERCKSPKTVKKENSELQDVKINIISEEQKRTSEIGIFIAEVRPLVKAAWQKCVLL